MAYPRKKKNLYGAKKTSDGFDSKLESRTNAKLLRFLEDKPNLTLNLQVPIQIIGDYYYKDFLVKGVRYIVDFAILDGNRVLLVEAKGLELDSYNIKKKILLTKIVDGAVMEFPDKDVQFIELKSDNIKDDALDKILNLWYNDNVVGIKDVFSSQRVTASKKHQNQNKLKALNLPDTLTVELDKISKADKTKLWLFNWLTKLNKKQRGDFNEAWKVKQKALKLQSKQLIKVETNFDKLISIMDQEDLFKTKYKN